MLNAIDESIIYALLKSSCIFLFLMDWIIRIVQKPIRHFMGKNEKSITRDLRDLVMISTDA